MCCRFSSLHIGRFVWRPGFVHLVRLPLNIEQNMLSQLFLTYAATSNFLDRAWMSSICSNAFLRYCVELFKRCFANKLVVPGSPVFSCLSPASHIIGLGPWHAEKAPGQWNFQTRALLRFFYCKAERAVKPCRSSRSNTRGGMITSHDTCKTGNKHQNPSNKIPTTKQKTTGGKC